MKELTFLWIQIDYEFVEIHTSIDEIEKESKKFCRNKTEEKKIELFVQKSLKMLYLYNGGNICSFMFLDIQEIGLNKE